MLHDIAIFDVIIPAVLAIFLITILIQLALDLWLGSIHFYNHIWHPALFRLASFFSIFSFLSLWLL